MTSRSGQAVRRSEQELALDPVDLVERLGRGLADHLVFQLLDALAVALQHGEELVHQGVHQGVGR